MKVFLEISREDLNIDISKYGGLVESVYINVCTYRLMFLVSSDIALYTHWHWTRHITEVSESRFFRRW